MTNKINYIMPITMNHLSDSLPLLFGTMYELYYRINKSNNNKQLISYPLVNNFKLSNLLTKELIFLSFLIFIFLKIFGYRLSFIKIDSKDDIYKLNKDNIKFKKDNELQKEQINDLKGEVEILREALNQYHKKIKI